MKNAQTANEQQQTKAPQSRVVMPAPSASPWRVDAVKFIILALAGLSIVWDAKISYSGNLQFGFTPDSAIFLMAIIFVSQLGFGVCHALNIDILHLGGEGENSGFINRIWIGVVLALYLLDIGSNCLYYGLAERFQGHSLGSLELWGGVAFIVGAACLTTFADEVLMRLYDAIEIGSRRNAVHARAQVVNYRAHQHYFSQKERLTTQAAKQLAEKDGGQWKPGDW